MAAFLGPTAAVASIASNYPPSNPCASTVLPSGSAGGPSASSTACSGVQPTSSTRSSAPVPTPSQTAAVHSGTTNNTSSGSGLAFTGSDVPLLAGIGTLMVVGGVMIVVQSRRRRA